MSAAAIDRQLDLRRSKRIFGYFEAQMMEGLGRGVEELESSRVIRLSFFFGERRDGSNGGVSLGCEGLVMELNK